jgi:phospholipid/cholesterol/gamma-HCH transport system substrate-binding protein
MGIKKIEIGVGLFMIIGLVSVTYLAVKMGDLNLLHKDRYDIIAKFTSASGLTEGAYVEAAGVRVGSVKSIKFDPDNFLAVVTMSINDNVHIQEDAIASIRTAGIIGEKFVKITPGGLGTLAPGKEIRETEPSISLEELISKYIFESGDKKK